MTTTKSTWQPHSVYMYLICLITLMMCIASVVGIVRSGIEAVYPQPAMVDYAIVKPISPDNVQPSAEQMAAEREYQELSSRRYTLISLVGNVTMLAIALPLYLYHWAKIRKERAAEGAQEA